MMHVRRDKSTVRVRMRWDIGSGSVHTELDLREWDVYVSVWASHSPVLSDPKGAARTEKKRAHTKTSPVPARTLCPKIDPAKKRKENC